MNITKQAQENNFEFFLVVHPRRCVTWCLALFFYLFILVLFPNSLKRKKRRGYRWWYSE